MSRRTVDLQCPAGHITRDAYVSADEQACGVCGKPANVWWGGGKAPATHVFQPVLWPGVGMLTSPEEVLAARQSIADSTSTPLERVVLHQDSGADHRTRSDARRHRAYTTRKRRGIDAKQWAEARNEVRKYGVNPLAKSKKGKI